MTAPNLVAAQPAGSATSGAGLIDDAAKLWHDGTQGGSALDYTLDGVSAGLDAIATLANPFGAAVSAGVGWILEHVPLISDLWDKLEGDPAAIEQAALTWRNIATELQQVRDSFYGEAAQIDAWQGDAHDAFVTASADFTTVLEGMISHAQVLSELITGIGLIVAALRQVAYSAISNWLCEDVIPEALASLASSWCTFGASVAAFLTWLTISTSTTCAALGAKVGDACVKAAEVYARIRTLLNDAEAAARAAGTGATGLRGAAQTANEVIGSNSFTAAMGAVGQAQDQHDNATS